MKIRPVKNISGSLKVPGDKSISHRSLILGALAKGTSRINGLSCGNDVQKTRLALEQLGINITNTDDYVIVESQGYDGFNEAETVLNCGNSGTTTRLMLGVLAAFDFVTFLAGDESLSQRPMDRVTVPLSMMGATILGRNENRYLPIAIRGGNLQPIHYRMPVASAQVKSAILLAGLAAQGETFVEEILPTRNHTELMLKAAGATIETDGRVIRLQGEAVLSPFDMTVQGDFSSAAFFLTAGVLLGEPEVCLEDVGLNPTRTRFLSLLQAMGADVDWSQTAVNLGEPMGHLTVRKSALKGISIPPEWVPAMIDEFPLVAVLATQAEGRTVVSGAAELRVKESDRIEAMRQGLTQMGVTMKTFPDGFAIEGPVELRGAEVDSFGDHRVAMALSIAGLLAKCETVIMNANCVIISYPEFFTHLGNLAPDSVVGWGRMEE